MVWCRASSECFPIGLLGDPYQNEVEMGGFIKGLAKEAGDATLHASVDDANICFDISPAIFWQGSSLEDGSHLGWPSEISHSHLEH